MRAKDVMTVQLVRLSPDNSIRQAARIMLDHHVSGLPVVDDEGRLVGVLSEGDLIRRTELCSGMGASPEDQALDPDARASAYVRRSSWRVGDAMTANPVTIDEDTSVSRIARLMQEHGIKRIPVMRNDKLIGIVSRADLLQAILAAKPDETLADDEAIKRSIVARLGENTGLESLDITVTVTDGVVHLWGVVETADCRRAARILAENVHGVRGVVEHFPNPSPQ